MPMLFLIKITFAQSKPIHCSYNVDKSIKIGQKEIKRHLEMSKNVRLIVS